MRPNKFSQIDKVAGIDEETYLKNKDRFLERSQKFALRSDAIFNLQKQPTQEDINNLKSGETIIINGQLYRKP